MGSLGGFHGKNKQTNKQTNKQKKLLANAEDRRDMDWISG